MLKPNNYTESCMINAVSYTHLDVYKRQDMYRLTRPKLIEQFISSDVAARMAQADKRGDLYKEKPFVMDYDCLLYTSRCV